MCSTKSNVKIRELAVKTDFGQLTQNLHNFLTKAQTKPIATQIKIIAQNPKGMLNS